MRKSLRQGRVDTRPKRDYGVLMNTSEEIKESIVHWRKLAEDELAKPTWDRFALPAICETRAEMYEQTARSLELELETGIAHCTCHLLPYEEARKLDALKARRR